GQGPLVRRVGWSNGHWRQGGARRGRRTPRLGRLRGPVAVMAPLWRTAARRQRQAGDEAGSAGGGGLRPESAPPPGPARAGPATRRARARRGGAPPRPRRGRGGGPGVGPDELVEDALEVLGGDPGPLAPDAQLQVAVGQPRRDPDRALGRRVPGGVVQQVGDY